MRTALARLTAGSDVDLAALHRELDELTATRDELARQQADGLITTSQFTTMNSGARERAKTIQRQLAEARTDHPTEKLIESADVAAAWDALTLDERLLVLAAAVTSTMLLGKPSNPGRGHRRVGDRHEVLDLIRYRKLREKCLLVARGVFNPSSVEHQGYLDPYGCGAGPSSGDIQRPPQVDRRRILRVSETARG